MSYNTFALFYDRLTENADYKVRSDYILTFFLGMATAATAFLIWLAEQEPCVLFLMKKAIMSQVLICHLIC